MSMVQGTLSVHTENIFPIIKKFLYSDHEIFLRELIANATDATQKIKTLAGNNEFQGEIGNTDIQVTLDKDAKTITISDHGVGLTADEVEKYINQIAFSGAEEFLEKYKDREDKGNIIGHFGLGFYSAFMVAGTVEIQSLSWKPDAEPVHWTCDGTTSYTLEKGKRTERGTDIILHINEDSLEFLEESRIEGILRKYNSFMPFTIRLGETVINEEQPIWIKSPSELTDEDYKSFYRKLYPLADEPLFWIHLNVDYPFTLTGILYFPKIKNSPELQKNKVQLYSNQVFVTDEVKEILPEFLTLLHGVLDSPDIPLNVSRSYLQADGNVKKISGHIVKKVADKLQELFNQDRGAFESKWPDIGFFIKYGMLTEEKFAERALKFSLLQDMEDSFYTPAEYAEKVNPEQTDKNENHIYLYATGKDDQHSYVSAAREVNYNVLLMDSPIDNHWMQKLESQLEKVQFKRVDADTLNNLIKKHDAPEMVLSSEEQEKLSAVYKAAIGENAQIKLESMAAGDMPVMLVQNEFMRRFKEMSRMSGQGDLSWAGDNYEIIINGNHPLAMALLNEDTASAEKKAKYLYDLARLNQNDLRGRELENFVKASIEALAGKN